LIDLVSEEINFTDARTQLTVQMVFANDSRGKNLNNLNLFQQKDRAIQFSISSIQKKYYNIITTLSKQMY